MRPWVVRHVKQGPEVAVRQDLALVLAGVVVRYVEVVDVHDVGQGGLAGAVAVIITIVNDWQFRS